MTDGWGLRGGIGWMGWLGQEKGSKMWLHGLLNRGVLIWRFSDFFPWETTQPNMNTNLFPIGRDSTIVLCK